MVRNNINLHPGIYRDELLLPEQPRENKWRKLGFMVIVTISFYIINNLLLLFVNGLVKLMKWVSH